MRDSGPALAAFVVALVLTSSSPLVTGCEAETPRTPPPRPAPALFPSAGSHVLLTRVYAHAARDNEFAEIGNAGLVAVDVSGWSLTDGEGTATFPRGAILPVAGRLVVARNSTSYAEDTLQAADFTFEDGPARRMEGGIPRLADASDDLRLRAADGRLIDAYLWGDSRDVGPGWIGRPADAMGRGEIAVRSKDDLGRWIDTDTSDDWDGLRRHRLGQSTMDPPAVAIRGRTTGVLSPDAGDEPLLSFLASAQDALDVAVYTLTSERIAAVIADLPNRGVRVRVLLDGGPVGGVDSREARIVGGLLQAGADVRWLVGGSDVVKRYRYLHGKYAVVDERAVWIGSENFGETGFPPSRDDGSRGWSVVVDDPAIAAELEAVFEADFDPRRRDSVSAGVATTDPLPPPPVVPPWPPWSSGDARAARLVVAPDTSLDPEGLLGVLASADERIWMELFYLDELWRGAPNPFLEASFEAARRGVSVRILLDGGWSSVGEDSPGNDRIVERLNNRARNETVDLEARLLEPRGRIVRLHNKGVVVDGRAVLVSSMNWALGSATENREIGILLEDADLAAAFERAFAADWEGRPASGLDAWRLEDPALLLALYGFVGAASAISLRKLRPGDKGIKPRARVRRRASVGAHLRRRSREVRLLPAELVAQPWARPGRRGGTTRGREEARGRFRGPQGD